MVCKPLVDTDAMLIVVHQRRLCSMYVGGHKIFLKFLLRSSSRRKNWISSRREYLRLLSKHSRESSWSRCRRRLRLCVSFTLLACPLSDRARTTPSCEQQRKDLVSSARKRGSKFCDRVDQRDRFVLTDVGGLGGNSLTLRGSTRSSTPSE